MVVLRAFLVVFCGWSLWGLAQGVPSEVREMWRAQGLRDEDLSVVVQAVDRELPLVSLNADVLRTPASLAKLWTTAAGLWYLGSDYVWSTDFYVESLPDSSGVLYGDLYVVGGGDPFLVEERLAEMIEDLQRLGIRHIVGDLVLDDSLFYLSEVERDAFSFDGKGFAAYNAIPSPLMVNFRTVRLDFEVREGKLEVSLFPNIKNWQVINEMDLVSGECSKNFIVNPRLVRDDFGYASLYLSGRFSRDCGKREFLAVMGEDSEQFYYLFYDLWLASGGIFEGSGRLGRPPEGARLFYQGLSLPLAEQIKSMNRLSNNVMTRQLLLTLGAERYGRPASLVKGREAVLEVLRDFDVPVEGMFLDNGSGLSREAKMSARSLAVLLHRLYGDAVFWDSLAVAGKSGTLSRRYRGENLAERVVGKTGTIDEVLGFAGYVEAQSGAVYVVVVIANGKNVAKSRAFQDALFKWVYAL